MSPRRVVSRLLMLLVASCLFAAPHTQAQDRKNCLRLKGNPKLITDCVEALFSQDPVHLTMSSLPPGNGLALGVVVDEQTHHVSPFAPPRDAVFSDDPDTRQGATERKGSLTETDRRLAFIGSTNLSWVATGSLSWLPAGYRDSHRIDLAGDTITCNRIGPICTKSVLALHFEGTHQQLNTISFYGLGPRSPAIKHTFPQNNTYGSVDVRMPLYDWLTADGGVTALKPVLPGSSDPLAVTNTFTNVQAPGAFSQPTYIHSHLGFSSQPVFDWNPITNDDEHKSDGPLMKKNLLFTLNNSFEFHSYAAVGESNSSFRQLVFSGDEAIQLGSNVRRAVHADDLHSGGSRMFYALLRHACGNTESTKGIKNPALLKVHQQCDYGRLDIRSNVTASFTGANAVIPFYMRPTVGGSDINSQTSLRGFPNYRFRDNDALLVQTDYSVPIRDPLGLLIFYDAGTVGPTFSSLGFAHLRQDAGFGMSVRIQGNVVARTYLAWGAGHGPLFGFNFGKLF